MNATVYTAKKMVVTKIDRVEITDTEGGQMIRFTVPKHLDIGEYILFVEDGRRIRFASWDAIQGGTTEQTIFYVPLNPAR